ncbi:MAG: Lrp/AsnC family transcriptional regulator [Rhizobiaceae bacterium]
MKLDTIDRMIINTLQDDFPLTPKPYADAAMAIGIAEHDLLDRLGRMMREGIITRFGPFLDAAAMGGAFCLCALTAPKERYDEIAQMVNGFPEVAHNYARDHTLNMWFVLATETEAGIATTADAIEAETGLTVFRFPKLREFFVGFRVAA